MTRNLLCSQMIGMHVSSTLQERLVDRVTQGSALYFSGHRGGSHHYRIDTLHACIHTRKYRLETTFILRLCTTYNAHKLRRPDTYFVFR